MDRERLLDLLVRYSYKYSDSAEFTLSSGRLSKYYVNCKATTMRREAAPLIASVFSAHIPESAKAVGGLTMGADPIAYAVRDLSKQHLDAFVVRKEAKEHGLGRIVEGPIEPGMQVVVVDDVVTTGTSTVRAIEACRQASLDIVAVLVLVDRCEDGGLQSIQRKAGTEVRVQAIFRRDELHTHWMLNLEEHEGSTSTGSRRAAFG